MNEEIMNPGTTGLTVNESMKADLLSAARWTNFLCIIGCIGMGLMVLVAILMFFLGSTFLRTELAHQVPGHPHHLRPRSLCPQHHRRLICHHDRSICDVVLNTPRVLKNTP